MQSIYFANFNEDKLTFINVESMTEELFWCSTKFCFNSEKEIYIYRRKELTPEEYDELIREAHKRFD